MKVDDIDRAIAPRRVLNSPSDIAAVPYHRGHRKRYTWAAVDERELREGFQICVDDRVRVIQSDGCSARRTKS